MPTNDFKVFAGQSSANVVSQTIYAAASYLGGGFRSGISQSAAFNKVWRQASIVAAAIAQTIADAVAVDVIDNGATNDIEMNFLRLVRSGGGLYVIDTGAQNTLVATLAPAPPSLVSMIGVPLRIKVNVTNTGATTLNLNAFGGIAVTTPALAALGSGALTAGGIATLVYDGTQFQKI